MTFFFFFHRACARCRSLTPPLPPPLGSKLVLKQKPLRSILEMCVGFFLARACADGQQFINFVACKWAFCSFQKLRNTSRNVDLQNFCLERKWLRCTGSRWHNYSSVVWKNFFSRTLYLFFSSINLNIAKPLALFKQKIRDGIRDLSIETRKNEHLTESESTRW